MSKDTPARSPIVHEPSLSHEIMIFVRNERGVTLPLYIRNDDTVDAIWEERYTIVRAAFDVCVLRGYEKILTYCLEVVNSLAVNERTLRGKGLHLRGRRLHNKERVSDLGIQSYTVITLEKNREPSLQRQQSFDKSDSQMDLEEKNDKDDEKDDDLCAKRKKNYENIDYSTNFH